jgi:ankyrin repeat protein
MVVDTRGNNILHATAGARFASPAIINALIEAGANIQALNLDGRTVLQRATVCYEPSRLAIVECLLNHGAVVT